MSKSSKGFPVWPVSVGLILALGIIAIIATRSSVQEQQEAQGPTPSPAAVSGELPAYDDSGEDPAVGTPAPVVEGFDFEGDPVTIGGAGTPHVVIFLAHWCPHCQAEVPRVQEWLDDGNLPEGVQVRSVSTSMDASRPNYPPEAWLEREGWTSPVLVDGDGSVADAYGLSAFPYFVFVDADGQVAGRATGEMEVAELESRLRALVS